MSPRIETTDILIIGAGPAGSVAAALLRQQGLEVLVLEREQFPRFSIGESLLPQSMEYIEKAGLLRDVVEAGFQYKNGAAFAHGDKRTAVRFPRQVLAGLGHHLPGAARRFRQGIGRRRAHGCQRALPA
jgi:2-polyprenyl-6-methoxyphenol hydroxylase-like FAD-dependent oxidoreductase